MHIFIYVYTYLSIYIIIHIYTHIVLLLGLMAGEFRINFAIDGEAESLQVLRAIESGIQDWALSVPTRKPSICPLNPKP